MPATATSATLPQRCCYRKLVLKGGKKPRHGVGIFASAEASLGSPGCMNLLGAIARGERARRDAVRSRATGEEVTLFLTPVVYRRTVQVPGMLVLIAVLAGDGLTVWFNDPVPCPDAPGSSGADGHGDATRDHRTGEPRR